MKKIIVNTIKFTILVAFSFIIFFNLYLNGKNHSYNTNLTTLIKVSEANAECIDDPYFNQGRCSQITNNCYFDDELKQCDWTQN